MPITQDRFIRLIEAANSYEILFEAHILELKTLLEQHLAPHITDPKIGPIYQAFAASIYNLEWLGKDAKLIITEERVKNKATRARNKSSAKYKAKRRAITKGEMPDSAIDHSRRPTPKAKAPPLSFSSFTGEVNTKAIEAEAEQAEFNRLSIPGHQPSRDPNSLIKCSCGLLMAELDEFSDHIAQVKGLTPTIMEDKD